MLLVLGPEWLSHVNANVLKTKLAMAIIGISSIHLLKTFIEVADLGSSRAETVTGNIYTSEGVLWQVVIHLVFILSALALAWIDRMSVKQELARHGVSTAEASRVVKQHDRAEDELVGVYLCYLLKGRIRYGSGPFSFPP